MVDAGASLISIARAAEGPGVVAGLDGAPQDALGPLVEVAGERDADAGRHLGHAREDHRGVGDAHRDALGQRLGGTTVGDVAAHEHEPLAVHVGDHVARAGDRPQSLGDRLEQVGTGGVAEAFLYEVEVVELHRHHRQAARVDFPEGEPGAEPVEVEDRDAGGAGISLGAGRRRPTALVPDRLRGQRRDQRIVGRRGVELGLERLGGLGGGCALHLAHRHRRRRREDVGARCGFHRRLHRRLHDRALHHGRVEEPGDEIGGAARPSPRPPRERGGHHGHHRGDRGDDHQGVLHDHLSERRVPALSAGVS